MQKGTQGPVVAPGLEHVQPIVMGANCASFGHALSTCGECNCAVLVFANNRQPALQAAISAAMVAPIFG